MKQDYVLFSNESMKCRKSVLNKYVIKRNYFSWIIKKKYDRHGSTLLECDDKRTGGIDVKDYNRNYS